MIRRPARGFTLIELMIALTVSGILIAMILQIFTKMSSGYRAQQDIAELQRRLSAAQVVIQRDVRQAGFQILDGFQIAGSAQVYSPVGVIDNADGFGPDQLRLFYADPSAQARVLTIPLALPIDPIVTVTIDDPDLFARDDLIVLTNHDIALTPDGTTFVNHTRACVAQIAAVVGPVVTLRTNLPWGSILNDHCQLVRSRLATGTTMMYRFVGRAYRIDPTRRELGVLQLSQSGGLRDDWEDLGVGFTDLQVASRWYEGEDSSTRRTTDTNDLDTDPERDWYSGADQTTLTAPLSTWTDARPLPMELRVTLVVRTRGRLDGVGSAQTPTLTDGARPDNNEVGNRGPVTLSGVPDASRPTELRGDAVYRYATVGSDLRNLAVAR